MKHSRATAGKVKCDKCGVEIVSGTSGKKHQACGGRRKGGGTSKKNCGVWR